jgi:hypothetical protein
MDAALSFYDPQKRRAKTLRATQDPWVDCLSFTALRDVALDSGAMTAGNIRDIGAISATALNNPTGGISAQRSEQLPSQIEGYPIIFEPYIKYAEPL